MSKDVLRWDIYEVSSVTTSLNNVMLRGRIRKFGIENNVNVLAENTEDEANRIRFAVLNTDDADTIINFLKNLIEGVKIDLVFRQCKNPVLSKLKVNDESRYNLQ